MERPGGATQRATHVLVLAHQTGEEAEPPMGTAQGFRMLLPPDELHTTLEYTGRTWHRTGTGLLITL